MTKGSLRCNIYNNPDFTGFYVSQRLAPPLNLLAKEGGFNMVFNSTFDNFFVHPTKHNEPV